MSIKNNYLFEYVSQEGNCFIFNLKEENVIARIFVLEDDIVRVLFTKGNTLNLKNTWLVAPDMEDIPLEGRDKLDVSIFSLPPCKFERNIHNISIETKNLKLIVNLDGFKITWYYKNIEENKDIAIMKDRNTQAYNLDGSLGEGICHYIERDINESYYGLGEKSGETERAGKRYRMMSIDPMGYDAKSTDPLYKHIPFYITRNSETGISHGIFYDNMSKCVFDMGNEMDNYHGKYRYFQSEAGDLDYYVIAGPKIKDVTKRYSWLTGKTIFTPKWSLGYSGSTMTYTDEPNAQERLEEFLHLCEKHDIICDSFQLSSGYTSIEEKRYVFNWNYDKFPNPKEFTKDYHEKNVYLCANIKPCLLKSHPKYEELKERELFIKNGTDNSPELAQFWDGLGSYIDFTNEEAFNWWKEQVKKQLLEFGIDSTWNDNNEYEIWSKNVQCNLFKENLNFELVRALQPLLMMKSSYEAQKEFSPTLRPYLISRSGCPGMQRYVQTWSGDNYTSWETLKYNIKMGIGLSLSGIYNLGHDVGGFAGPAPSPELFLRWVQNGIFYPRFTIHSWNFDKTVNVPWMYSEITDKVRNLIKFRYKITPYLYTALYNAHENYEPIIKPTFLDFENDKKTFEECDDFILGDCMLITSVVEEGASQRAVYLPKLREGWYDFNTQDWYEGGQTVTIPAPLEYSPFMVKAGSIIPVNDNQSTFLTKSDDKRSFYLFPYKKLGLSEYSLYEDDGISLNYKNMHTKINIKMDCNEKYIEISLNKKGNFELPYKKISFYLPKTESRALVVNKEILQEVSNRKFVYDLK